MTASQSGYESGKAPVLHVAVTNEHPSACDLAATPDATLQVLAASRDGQPLTPTFVRTLVIDGLGQAIAARVRSAAPGTGVSFDVDTAANRTLPVSTPLRDGSALTAHWPLDADGRYELQLVYQVPAVAGPAGCAGLSNVAVVSFTVGAPDLRLWLVVGGAGVVLAAAVALFLLAWARRRRHPSSGGPAATSATTAAGAALAIVVATLSTLVWDARPAHAGVSYGLDPSGSVFAIYQDCLGKVISSDPQLWSKLTGPGSPTVVVYPWFYSGNEALKGGGARDSLVRWDPFDTSPFLDDPSGAALDPCASLYHELRHAGDRADDADSSQPCDDTGILVDEVRATLAENRFRARNGLTERTTYDGKKLPQSVDDCVEPKRKDRRTADLNPPVCRGVNGPCGRTTGDPHMLTFDGYYYDFQAVGEFVAAESSKDDFEVQVRQSAYRVSRTVSVNAAVAMRVNGVRLGFYLSDGDLVVRQDGTVVSIPYGETTLAGGGRVSRQADHYNADAYIITWPDGSIAWLELIGPWGIHLSVLPSTAQRGALRGLLGNDNGEAADDLATAAGQTLAQPPGFTQLYRDFAPGWRITAANSLFDYVAGQDTSTFTDLTFPDRQQSAADLSSAQREAAQTACDLLGISEPALLDACILDVATTGQAAFASSMSDIQVLRTPDAAPTGTTQTLRVDQPGGQAQTTFDGVAGQRVYVQVATTLPDGCGVLRLVTPDNTTLAIGCLSQGKGEIDGTVLPKSGTYRLIVDPDGTSVGDATVRLFFSLDQAGQITPDGSDGVASITVPGAVARLSFAASAGQKYFVDILSSTLPDGCGTVALASPTDIKVALGCTGNGTGIIDTTLIKENGQHTLRVDPPADATGSVRVRLTAVTDHKASIILNGPAVLATVTEAGAVSRLSFTATAGQRVAIELTDSTLPSGCGIPALVAPNGSTIALGCTNADGTGSLDPTVLPSTGQYVILIDAPDRRVGEAKVRIHT